MAIIVEFSVKILSWHQNSEVAGKLKIRINKQIVYLLISSQKKKKKKNTGIFFLAKTSFTEVYKVMNFSPVDIFDRKSSDQC